MQLTSPIADARLVNFEATDGLRMKGFLAISPENHATIVHIHGHCGNFYENDFIPVMTESYTGAGINFLSVNNRGHDGIAEAYRSGRLEYVGGSYEVVEECIYDIRGAVEFAQELGSRVILQGHSLGCLKVLYYLYKTGQPLDFILLSAADPYQLQSDYIHPETVEEQVNRIKREYAVSFLFSVRLEYRPDLEQGEPSEGLLQELESHGIDLYDGITIRTDVKGSRWRIDVGDQTYTVMREGETLNIYAGSLYTMLPSKEFGVRANGVAYHVPVSYYTLLSLFDSSLIGFLRYREPLDYFLKTRALIYYGGADPLWTETRETVEAFFQKRVSDIRLFYCEDGDHHFRGFESLVCEEIAKWVNEGGGNKQL